jgi:hypothetical protein
MVCLPYQPVQSGPSVLVAPYVVGPYFQRGHALIICVKCSSSCGWRAADGQDKAIMMGIMASNLHLAMHDFPRILLATGKEKG